MKQYITSASNLGLVHSHHPTSHLPNRVPLFLML